MRNSFSLRLLLPLFFLCFYHYGLVPSYEPYYLEYDPQEYYCLNIRGQLYSAPTVDHIDWDNCIVMHFNQTDSLFDPHLYARKIDLFDDE